MSYHLRNVYTDTPNIVNIKYTVPCGALRLSISETDPRLITYKVTLLECLFVNVTFVSFFINTCSSTKQCLCGSLNIEYVFRNQNQYLLFCGILNEQYHVIPSNNITFVITHPDYMITRYSVKLIYVAIVDEIIPASIKSEGHSVHLYQDLNILQIAEFEVYLWKIKLEISKIIRFDVIKYSKLMLNIFDGYDFRTGVSIVLNRTCIKSQYFIVNILAMTEIGKLFSAVIEYTGININNTELYIEKITKIRIRSGNYILHSSFTFNCHADLFPYLRLTSVSKFYGTTQDNCISGGFLLRIALTSNDMITNHGPYCDITLFGLMDYFRGDKRSISNYYNQIVFYSFKSLFLINIDIEISCSICEGLINPCSLDQNTDRMYISKSYIAQFYIKEVFMIVVKRKKCLTIHLLSTHPRNCLIMITSNVMFRYRAWTIKSLDYQSNQTEICDGFGFKVVFNSPREQSKSIGEWIFSPYVRIHRDTCFSIYHSVIIEMEGESRDECPILTNASVITLFTTCGSVFYSNPNEKQYVYFYSLVAINLTPKKLFNIYTQYQIYSVVNCKGVFVRFVIRTMVIHRHEAISEILSHININILIRKGHMAQLTIGGFKNPHTCKCFLKYYTFKFLYPPFVFEKVYKVN